jgi:undecaprenyl-diphosphatase
LSTWDLRTELWLNGLGGHSRPFDLLVGLFTQYAPLLFAVLFAFYFVRRAPRREEMRRTVLLAGLSGVMAVLVTLVVGHLVYRDRPFVALPGQIHLLIPHPADSSFPSDHTMGSAAFAAGMWRAPSPSARYLFAITALLVGLSRLVAGVHWPSDVLASFILGSAIAWATFTLAAGPLSPVLDWVLRLYGRLERQPSHK